MRPKRVTPINYFFEVVKNDLRDASAWAFETMIDGIELTGQYVLWLLKKFR